jgi:thioredoxin-like negative regulator of GroEL
MAQQKKPGAVALAEQAVKLAPNRPPLLDTLAVAYAAEGQLNRALDLQGQVVATSPDWPDYRFTLAKLQLQSGDKDAARENLIKLSKYGRAFSRHEEVNRLLKELTS